jgi:hypothetical protein
MLVAVEMVLQAQSRGNNWCPAFWLASPNHRFAGHR